MKNKHIKKIIPFILAALLVFSVMNGAIGITVAKAAVTQDQIDKLKAQKKEYDQKKQEIQAQIDSTKSDKLSETAKKSVLDDLIMLTGEEITNITETIDNYTTLIAEKEAEVTAAQDKEDAQLTLYKAQVRDMEENGSISYLEIIFDSSSFADLLARIDFISDVMTAEDKIYQDLIEDRNATIAAENDLEQAQQGMEDEKAQLSSKNDELTSQVAEANDIIAQLEATLETEQALYDQESADGNKIQDEINQKVAELQKQEAAKAASMIKGTGKLIWPVPSTNIVTSPFGMRLHPVFKVYRMHTGVDIAAAYGAKIVAADSGTVISSTYDSSYGNYVVISHGNGVTTLYAHLSSRSVSVGQTVTQGQTVGLAGATGVATGPHLHFEVSVNGTRVDPLKYFTNYVLRG